MASAPSSARVVAAATATDQSCVQCVAISLAAAHPERGDSSTAFSTISTDTSTDSRGKNALAPELPPTASKTPRHRLRARLDTLLGRVLSAAEAVIEIT